MAHARPTTLAPASSPLSEPLLPPSGQPGRRAGEADRDLEGSIANASAPDRGGPTQTHNAAPTEAVGENQFLDVEQGGVCHESSAARLSSSSSSDVSVRASGSSPSSSSSSSLLREADSRTRPSIPPLTAAASTRGGGTAAATAAAAAAAAPFGALASRFLRQSSRSSSGRGSGSGGGGGGSSERWLLREESANGAAGTSQQPPPDANRPQPTDARDADDQQGLRTSEWAYSRPVVLLDLLWNAAFIAAALVTLALSTAEHPGAPLRVWVLGYSLQCAVHMACVWAEYDRRRRHRLRLAARERRNRLLLQRRQQQQRQQRQAQRLRQLTLTGRSRAEGLGEREVGGVQEQEEQQWRSQGLWLPGAHRGSEEQQQLRQGAAWGEGSSAGGAVTDSRTWATARGHVSGQEQQQHQQHGQRELGETRPDDVTAAEALLSGRSSGPGSSSGSDSVSRSRRSRLMARLGFVQQGRLSRLLLSEEDEGVEREEQDALVRGGREEGDASSDDSDTESFPRRVESANTMLSFLWWGLGLCWLLSTFDDTFQDSPMLSWLVTVFLAFDVFFVVFCAALACVIGVAVCCCLPCIIAMLYAVGEQEGASEEDIQALPRFKYTRLNPQAPCSEPQQEKEVASTAAGPADGTSTQTAAAAPEAAAASEKEAAGEHGRQSHVGGGGHSLGPCSDAQSISLNSEGLLEETAASPAPIPHPSSSSSSTDVVVQVDKDSSTASPAPAPQGTQETAPAAAAAAATEAAVASGGSQRAAGGAAAAGIARPLQSRVGSSVLGAIATTATAGLLGGGAGQGAGGGAGEKVIGEDDAECCICLCAYDDGTILRQLPCGHHFHLSCVDKWLRSKPTCPLCKFDIVRQTRVSDTARQSSSSATAAPAPLANRGSGTASSTRTTAAAQQDLPGLQQASAAAGDNEGGQSRGSTVAADDASRNAGNSRTTPEETAAALLVPETVETGHELMVGVGEGFFGRADTRLREFFQRAAGSFRDDAH